jgi:hypothetical protein
MCSKRIPALNGLQSGSEGMLSEGNRTINPLGCHSLSDSRLASIASLLNKWVGN